MRANLGAFASRFAWLLQGRFTFCWFIARGRSRQAVTAVFQEARALRQPLEILINGRVVGSLPWGSSASG